MGKEYPRNSIRMKPLGRNARSYQHSTPITKTLHASIKDGDFHAVCQLVNASNVETSVGIDGVTLSCIELAVLMISKDRSNPLKSQEENDARIEARSNIVTCLVEAANGSNLKSSSRIWRMAAEQAVLENPMVKKLLLELVQAHPKMAQGYFASVDAAVQYIHKLQELLSPGTTPTHTSLLGDSLSKNAERA